MSLCSAIQTFYQAVQKSIACNGESFMDADDAGLIVLRITHTIDTGDRSDYDDVSTTGQQIGGGTQSKLIDFLIDREIFFNIRVRNREIRFRLIIVIIRNKILYGIVRKELLKLTIKLRRQGLVVRQHQYRSLNFLDDVGYGKGFTGTRDAKQDL